MRAARHDDKPASLTGRFRRTAPEVGLVDRGLRHERRARPPVTAERDDDALIGTGRVEEISEAVTPEECGPHSDALVLVLATRHGEEAKPPAREIEIPIADDPQHRLLGAPAGLLVRVATPLARLREVGGARIPPALEHLQVAGRSLGAIESRCRFAAFCRHQNGFRAQVLGLRDGDREVLEVVPVPRAGVTTLPVAGQRSVIGLILLNRAIVAARPLHGDRRVGLVSGSSDRSGGHRRHECGNADRERDADEGGA